MVVQKNQEIKNAFKLITILIALLILSMVSLVSLLDKSVIEVQKKDSIKIEFNKTQNGIKK